MHFLMYIEWMSDILVNLVLFCSLVISGRDFLPDLSSLDYKLKSTGQI